MIAGIPEQIHPAANSQFFSQICPVTFHGADADAQFIRNLFVGIPLTINLRTSSSRAVRVSTAVVVFLRRLMLRVEARTGSFWGEHTDLPDKQSGWQ